MFNNNWENKMYKATLENKSAVNLHGVKPGDKIVIDVDKNNIPKQQHWRRRLRDAAIDNCIEIATIENEKNEIKED